MSSKRLDPLQYIDPSSKGKRAFLFNQHHISNVQLKQSSQTQMQVSRSDFNLHNNLGPINKQKITP